MGWTKRQFVIQAFEEVGYASYKFDLQNEQLESALRRMDAMMSTWNGLGIRVGYPIPTSPENSDLDQETNVPDSANEAIYTNLSVRIAPTIGKTVSLETGRVARSAYRVLLARATQPIEKQFPGTMPSGAGNKSRNIDFPFVNGPTDPLLAGDDSLIDFD